MIKYLHCGGVAHTPVQREETVGASLDGWCAKVAAFIRKERRRGSPIRIRRPSR